MLLRQIKRFQQAQMPMHRFFNDNKLLKLKWKYLCCAEAEERDSSQVPIV